MTITLDITRYVLDAHSSIELRDERDELDIEWPEDLDPPLSNDSIEHPSGRTFRVTSRKWKIGGLVLRVEERVQEERAA